MVFPAAHVTTPASGDVDNGAAITTGVRLTVDAAKTCDGIAFRVPGTNTGTYTGTLYETTAADPGGAGTVLSSGTIASGSVTAGTWAVAPLAVPQALVTGKVYTAALHSSSGRIVATSNGLAGGISGNGVNLLAPGTDPNPPGLGSMVNGVFKEGAAPDYPTDTFNNTDYFVDLSLQTGQSASLGTTTETDTAGTLGRAKAKALGAATETATAQPVGDAKARTLGVAGSTDTAGTFGDAKARALGVAGDTATAQALARSKAATLGAAGDTATAGTLGRVKARTLGVAADTATAGTFARTHSRALGVAVDTSVAGALGKVLGLNPVTETDVAPPITVAGQSDTPAATQRAFVVRGPQRATTVRGAQRATVVRGS